MTQLTSSVAAISAGMLFLVACAGVQESADRSSPSPTTSVMTGSAGGRQTVPDRCGPPTAPARWIELRGGDGSRLTAAVAGDGPVTAIFAHETSSSGFCGFWPYAAWLAENYGIRSVLVDLCGYGESRCRQGPFARDEPAQVELAVQWARRHGARETTLVGASLGGAAVSVAAARIEPPVDAMINLSGPVRYVGLDVAAVAPKITVPSLLVIDDHDRVATVAQYRRLLKKLGTAEKRLFIAPYGHGWATLGIPWESGFRPSRVGKTVAAWIDGRHTLN